MFRDRKEVGLRPLERLPPLDPENTVALALPHGGLPVADVIAEALGFPLDIALVWKDGYLGQPEFAFGAGQKRTFPWPRLAQTWHEELALGTLE